MGGPPAWVSQLLDEELVEDAPTGRKAVRLTDEGATYVEGHSAEMAAVWAPFTEEEEDLEAVNYKQVIGQAIGAIVKVLSTGTPEQREKTLEILADTRRRIFRPAGRGTAGPGGRACRE